MESIDLSKYMIPTTIENEISKDFYENSDFRFFKSEFGNNIKGIPEKEKINFYKFAKSLGCFSKKKIMDKNGKETQIILAQKACSLLANLIKTDEMKLRKLYKII